MYWKVITRENRHVLIMLDTNFKLARKYKTYWILQQYNVFHKLQIA